MKKTVLAIATLLAACGNNNTTNPDAPAGSGTDAGTDAGSGSGSNMPGPRAVIAAPPADFVTPPGVLSALDVNAATVQMNLIADAVGTDPVLRKYGDTVYLINRASPANITLVDANTLTLISQIGTGESSDPYDVAVVGDKLYVPDYFGSGVIELSASGESITKTIDLGSAVGDPDGAPNCISAYVVGSDVYIACERLAGSDNEPEGSGVLVVLDAGTDTVRTTVGLPAPNPQTHFAKLPNGDLLIPAEPYDDPSSGCIIEITPGTTPTATCAIANTALNGTANHVDVAPDGTAWIAVTAFDYSTSSLSTWDGATVTNAISDASETISDVAACPDGKIVATDQTAAAPGVRIFSGSGAELTTMALSIGDPPGYGDGTVCYTP